MKCKRSPNGASRSFASSTRALASFTALPTLFLLNISPVLADETPDLVVGANHTGQYAVEAYHPGGGIFRLTSDGSITDDGNWRPALTTDPYPGAPIGWKLTIDGDVTAAGLNATGVGLYGPDSLLINSGANVNATATGIYVTAEGTTVENRGHVSGGQHGILANRSLNLTNTEGAIINGPIQMSAPGANGGYVDNAGLITGGTVIQIVLRGDSELVNRQSGQILTANNGLYVTQGRGTVRNAGTIASSPALGDATTYSGVYLANSGSVENTGQISGPIGVRFGNSSGMSAGVATLVNSGNIVGSSLYPVLFWNVEEAVLNNAATGSLKGGMYGVFISGTPRAEIESAGLISGETGIAFSGAGTRTILNTGKIVGTGGTAIRKTGGSFELTLGTGSDISGRVEADASDMLRLEGTGSEDDALVGFGLVSMQGDAWSLDGEVSGSSLDVAAGVLTVGSNAEVSFTDISVASGSRFAVNGTLQGSLVIFGQLSGTGNVGPTRIAAGGVHAPGNSPGTQTITGDYINHGTLLVEVAPDLSDKLVVNGTVDITGATLQLLLSPDNAADWNIFNGPFTLIANDGTDAVTGTFNSVTRNLLFLDQSLDYAGGDGNDVTLELTRNNVEFGDVAGTRNQKSTADAISLFASGNPVWNAISMQLDEDSARYALDLLSGEIHASAGAALIEESHFLRDAAMDRLLAAFGRGSGQDLPVMAFGPGGPEWAAADTDRFAIWGQGFGGWGTAKGDGNAAELDRSSGGFLMGADTMIGPDWRLGLLAGYSRSTFDVDARASSGDSRNFHLGLYGGTKLGGLSLRFGAAYGWHDIETKRSVTFPGFTDTLSADYDAATAQVFGELGHEFVLGQGALEPFAGLAYVNVDTDGFTETGGASALSSPGGNSEVTFTTLGLRAATEFSLGGTKATARGMLGWRHAFGDTTPGSTNAFAGGAPFSIAGTPIAENAAVIEAGLDFALTDNATLAVGYQGQIASGVNDHGVRGDFTVRF